MSSPRFSIKEVNYSASQFKRDMAKLAKMVLSRYANEPIDGLVGIPRNGFIIASALSHAIGNVKMEMALHLDEKWDKVPVVGYNDLLVERDIIKGQRFILVDDIWDSGKTLDREVSEMRQMHEISLEAVIVLHAKPAYVKAAYADIMVVANPLTAFDGWVYYFWEGYGK